MSEQTDERQASAGQVQRPVRHQPKNAEDAAAGHENAIRHIAYAEGYADGVAAERERLRGYFRDALADHGITWPGEVDILYDKCFGAPYVPNEEA